MKVRKNNSTNYNYHSTSHTSRSPPPDFIEFAYSFTFLDSTIPEFLQHYNIIPFICISLTLFLAPHSIHPFLFIFMPVPYSFIFLP